MKPWLHDNKIKVYSTHNNEKIAVIDTFIRALKSEIYKHMATVSKNVYINRLHEIVSKYN